MAPSTSAPTAPAKPPAPRRPVVVGVLAAVILAMLAVLTVVIVNHSTTPAGPTPVQAGPPLYVSPSGRDASDGTSAATALGSIQAALEKATPGTVINLAPGVYHEEPQTVRDGAPGAPITIKGPETGTDRSGRYRAVVYGTGRIFNIDHSWITLDGFTVDGEEQLASTPFPTDLRAIDAFKESVQDRVEDSRLVYVGSNDDTRDVTGVTITNMFLSSAGGECVRLRNNAHDNTISNSVVQYCGMYGKGGGEDRTEYHNGEGVYIGTSPKSDDQPMAGTDTSSHNVVSHNVIRTFGSECFNVKENAHDNVFEDNVCSSNAESIDFEGSNVELRGYENVVRRNQISDSAGYTIKIQTDGEEYDKGGNVVENNRLSGAAAEIFKIKSAATQGSMCGNTVASGKLFNTDGATPAGVTSPC
jgi:Right handed beta helix region